MDGVTYRYTDEQRCRGKVSSVMLLMHVSKADKMVITARLSNSNAAWCTLVFNTSSSSAHNHNPFTHPQRIHRA